MDESLLVESPASLPRRVSPALNGAYSHQNWRRGEIIHWFHSDLSASINAASQLGAFDAVVKQMLEDVQERLVYRTHIYIQTDITGYKPAPGDLAYPEKLEMMEVSPDKLQSRKSLKESLNVLMTIEA